MDDEPVQGRRVRRLDAVALAVLALLLVVPLAGVPGMPGIPVVRAAAAGGGGAGGGPAGPAAAPARSSAPPPSAAWVRTWHAASQPPVAPGSVMTRGLGAVTVRMRVHTSVGGDALRLSLSNLYGVRPLEVVAVTVARPADVTGRSAATQPGTLRPVTFAGRPGTTLPVGWSMQSDPLGYDVPGHGDLLVSVAYAGPTVPLSGHRTTTSTSWVSGPGDHTGDVAGGAFVRSFTGWPTLDAVDVVPAGGAQVPGLVAFGDSITEGAASGADTNRRWPDALADMIPGLAVANAGIGGNGVVSAAPRGGAPAVSRLDRDVLDVPGVRVVVVAEGINDISRGYAATDVATGLRQIGVRARARGLSVVLGTVTPFRGRDSWTPALEKQREALNTWIRTRAVAEGAADVVVDLDAALRDPQMPTLMAARFDSGDHIHPDPAGYAVIAATVEPAVRTLLDR